MLLSVVFQVPGSWIFPSGAPENYRFMHAVRQGRQGGGVTCIYNSDFNCKSTTIGEFMSFEYVAINLFNDMSVLIIVIYRPQKSIFTTK